MSGVCTNLALLIADTKINSHKSKNLIGAPTNLECLLTGHLYDDLESQVKNNNPAP